MYYDYGRKIACEKKWIFVLRHAYALVQYYIDIMHCNKSDGCTSLGKDATRTKDKTYIKNRGGPPGTRGRDGLFWTINLRSRAVVRRYYNTRVPQGFGDCKDSKDSKGFAWKGTGTLVHYARIEIEGYIYIYVL